jgi:hypothetical protein
MRPITPAAAYSPSAIAPPMDSSAEQIEPHLTAHQARQGIEQDSGKADTINITTATNSGT